MEEPSVRRPDLAMERFWSLWGAFLIMSTVTTLCLFPLDAGASCGVITPTAPLVAWALRRKDVPLAAISGLLSLTASAVVAFMVFGVSPEGLGVFGLLMVLACFVLRKVLPDAPPPPVPTRCVYCQYSLAGLPGSVCPECGVDQERPWQPDPLEGDAAERMRPAKPTE